MKTSKTKYLGSFIILHIIRICLSCAWAASSETFFDYVPPPPEIVAKINFWPYMRLFSANGYQRIANLVTVILVAETPSLPQILLYFKFNLLHYTSITFCSQTQFLRCVRVNKYFLVRTWRSDELKIPRKQVKGIFIRGW